MTYEQITERLNQMSREGVLRSIGHAPGLMHDAEHITTPKGSALCREVLVVRPWYMGGCDCLYHVTDSEGTRRTFARSTREDALRAFYALCEQEGLCKNT